MTDTSLHRIDSGQTDPERRRELAHAALAEVLASNRVALVAQDIVGPGLDESRRWVEVLARPQVGKLAVDPTDVVRAAEEAGHGLAFDEIVLAQTMRWMRSLPAIARVSINITHEALASPRLSSVVLSLADRHQIDPARICLELSELYTPRNLFSARRELERLHRKGVEIALDDVGGGHANLRLCSGGLVTIMKIDRQVVWDAVDLVGDLRLLHGLIAMARRLSLETVVEGVETPATIDALRELGPVFLQGYALATPKRVPLEPVGQGA